MATLFDEIGIVNPQSRPSPVAPPQPNPEPDQPPRGYNAPPLFSRCRRIKMRFARGREHMVAGLPCRSWGCADCWPFLQQIWIRRLRYHLEPLGLDAEVFVGHVCPRVEWDRARQAIHRAHGQWCSVVDERTGQRLVISTARFGGSDCLSGIILHNAVYTRHLFVNALSH
jgi:hypothetical protein